MIRQASMAIALFIGLSMQAQDSLHLAGIGGYYQGQVRLRWAPVNWLQWNYPTDCGFTIDRQEIEIEGRLVDPLARRRSEYRFDPLSCQPMEAWESQVEQDTFAGIAALSLWEESAIPADPVDRAFDQNNRKSFILWAADHSFTTAQLLGLGFLDSLVQPNRAYTYRIFSNCPQYISDTLWLLVATYQDRVWPPVQDVSIRWTGQQVELEWLPYPDFAYSSYTIYRSEDGDNWHPLHQAPLLELESEKAESGRQYFSDSTAMENRTYYYRIKGTTSLGYPGPLSDQVSFFVPPALPELDLRIEQIVELDGRIQVHWVCAEEAAPFVRNWQLWRYTNPDSTSRVIVTGLPSRIRTSVDEVPGPSNYYRVEAQDSFGRSVWSNVVFYQVEDSLAPPWPEQMTGYVDTFGYVHLNWSPSQAQDLKGYRVYRNYRPELPAALRTAAIKPDTSLLDSLDIRHRLDDTIYYTLRTVDFHENESAYRPFVAIALPDLVPPGAPVIAGWEGISAGARLKFLPSNSSDVVHYQIQRSLTDDQDWLTVGQFTADDLPSSFIDTLLPVGVQAYYRLRAIDEVGLWSSSATVLARRLDNQILQGILHFSVHRSRDDSHQIVLTWQTQDNAKIDKAIIYRALNEDPFVNYRISIASAWEKKENILQGDYTDHLTTTPDHIRYKLIIQYQDGSYSAWSKEVDIQFK